MTTTDVRPRAAVYTPTPRLTVTIEAGGNGAEIHLHAGGQGLWQARMLALLDVDVVVCGHFAGEVGDVVSSLISSGSVRVVGGAGSGTNGCYVHDRRGGERVEVAQMAATAPDRHELDDLFGTMLVEAVAADVCLIGGADEEGIVDDDLYRRMAADLVATGTPVIVDVHGSRLDAVLAGGAVTVKISDEELAADGRVDGPDLDAVIRAVCELVDHGAGAVLVTRGREPTVAWIDGELSLVVAPVFEATETRGAGDSFIAAYAAALAHGEPHRRALQVGAAAGALNVTRHGLASGRRDGILKLADQVEVRPA